MSTLLDASLAKLTDEERSNFKREFVRRKKSVLVTYLFWLIGCQYFYLGNIGLGVAYFVTGGFLIVGAIINIFTIPSMVARANEDISLQLIKDIKATS